MTQPSPPPVPALVFLVAVVVSPVSLESSAAFNVWGVLRFVLKLLLVIVLVAAGRVRGGGSTAGPPPRLYLPCGGGRGGKPGGGGAGSPSGGCHTTSATGGGRECPLPRRWPRHHLVMAFRDHLVPEATTWWGTRGAPQGQAPRLPATKRLQETQSQPSRDTSSAGEPAWHPKIPMARGRGGGEFDLRFGLSRCGGGGGAPARSVKRPRPTSGGWGG